MGVLFQRGFNAVDEEKKRQEEAKKNKGSIFRFFLTKDKEEADITFLTELPVNFYEHTIKKTVNGKERYDSIPCTGDGCVHCADGDNPSFKSAWLIIDHREVKYKDKDGKTQTVRDQLRLLVYGTKNASLLNRKSEKYGLTGREYTVVRLGTGTSTTYTFEHGDKYDLTEKEIESVLPDNVVKLYDGTMDSLYKIIETEISKLAGVKDEDSEDETEEIDESITSVDEEDKPRRTLGKKRTLNKRVEKSSKPTSIKQLMRNKRK